MRKLSILLICLFAMLAAGTSLKAQEVTITLSPGWTWISYLGTEPQDFATALGDFTPMQGDVIKSKWGTATYRSSGRWVGTISRFEPGYGYHYKSTRTAPVQLTIGTPLPQQVVTTTEPTDITTISAVVGGMVTVPEGSHVFMRGVCWGIEPHPDIDGNHTTEETGVGEFSRMLDGLAPGITFYVRAYALTDYGLAYGEELSFTTIESSDHDYVDLGLPSGRLWATCNVGADTPEGYGDYFAWGETMPKDTYTWDTYTYHDHPAILPPEHDAATTHWGLDWRMPTIAEWQELYDNTTSTWVTQNGVDGMLFTSSNGNSLFLPTAGIIMGDELYEDLFYWSSSSSSYYQNCACYFSIYAAMDDEMGNQFVGMPVRPVRSVGNPPTGALNGMFTINSDGGQVRFSQGNLQYIGSASTPYWKFADNQWDYLGDNGQGSTDQDVDRDLFGWGTSGFNHGAVCYQPWSTNNNYESDYYAYGSRTCNLYDQTGMADWGYNAISNGGDAYNQWRTLTWREWSYMLKTRNTTSGIRYAKAQVNNVNGIIILPDNWNVYYFSLNSPNDYDAGFDSNIITASQWSTLEQYGVVFLPASGLRGGTNVNLVGSRGYYWSSSYNNSGGVFVMALCEFPLGIVGGNYGRTNGVSVRLVCDVEEFGFEGGVEGEEFDK